MTKIVFTGPPFAGKSTVINGLWERGYNVVHESARVILDSLRDLKFRDPHKERRDLFQREVIEHQIRMESQNQNVPLTFYDRGIVDNVAYYRLDGLQPPRDLISLASAQRYDTVFYFEPLEKAKMSRTISDEEEVRVLEKLIREAYAEFAYTPIEVSEMEAEKRIDFILGNI